MVHVVGSRGPVMRRLVVVHTVVHTIHAVVHTSIARVALGYLKLRVLKCDLMDFINFWRLN